MAIPAVAGGGLSLAAVIALSGPTAREYFATLWTQADHADFPDDRGSSRFWRAAVAGP